MYSSTFYSLFTCGIFFYSLNSALLNAQDNWFKLNHLFSWMALYILHGTDVLQLINLFHIDRHLDYFHFGCFRVSKATYV